MLSCVSSRSTFELAPPKATREVVTGSRTIVRFQRPGGDWEVASTEIRTIMRIWWIWPPDRDTLQPKPHVRADDYGGTGMPDLDSSATFADAVRLRRRQLGLGQGELADLAGVSERLVYALEHGKPSVQLNKVIAVLSALGLHLELRRGGSATVTPVEEISR